MQREEWQANRLQSDGRRICKSVFTSNRMQRSRTSQRGCSKRSMASNKNTGRRRNNKNMDRSRNALVQGGF